MSINRAQNICIQDMFALSKIQDPASPTSLLWITSFSPQRWLRPSYYVTAKRVEGYDLGFTWYSASVRGCPGQLLGIGKSSLAKFWSSENWGNLV